MGKRKREEGGDSSSPKKKKEKPIEIKEEEEDPQISDFYIPEEIYNDTIDGRKKKKSVTFDPSFIHDFSSDEVSTSRKFDNMSVNGSLSEYTNGTTHLNINDSDYVYYLIRKPLEVSLEDLKSIKLPIDPSKSKKIKLKTETTAYSLKLTETPRQTLYFPSKKVITAKDTQKIRCMGTIAAQGALMPVVKKVAGPPILEPGENVPEDYVPDIEYKSIRKEPDVKLDEKRQRLFAFGVVDDVLTPKKKKKVKTEILEE